MKSVGVYLLAAYPVLHVGLGVFVKYMPDPGESKSWYSAIYHALAYFAIGNGK